MAWGEGTRLDPRYADHSDHHAAGRERNEQHAAKAAGARDIFYFVR